MNAVEGPPSIRRLILQWLAAGLLAIALAAPAKAEIRAGDGAAESVATLKRICQQSDNFCRGYIGGVLDTLEFLPDIEGQFCLPDGLTYADGQAVVVRFMNRSDINLYDSASKAVLAAIMQAYPCQ